MKAQAPTRTDGPDAELLPLADAKAHLRVDCDDDDDYIEGLAAAATSYLDGYSGILGVALCEQEWAQSFDGFPAERCLRLALGPVLAADDVEVAYFDAAGDAQTFTQLHLAADAIGPLLELEDGATWPSTATRPDAVTVTWTCGFGAAADVPPAIVLGAKLLVGHWYANREAVNVGNIVSELPFTAAALLNPHRKVGI